MMFCCFGGVRLELFVGCNGLGVILENFLNWFYVGCSNVFLYFNVCKFFSGLYVLLKVWFLYCVLVWCFLIVCM